jgi:predicted dehydrogenase
MEDVELVVADTDAQRLQRVCREHNVARGSTALAEFVRHGLDRLMVATPLPCHVAQAIGAMEAAASDRVLPIPRCSGAGASRTPVEE